MKYVIDIDDTILYSELKDGHYILKGHNKKVVEKINKLYQDNEIIIHTGRHWNKLIETQKQLDEVGVKYNTLVMGKPCADYYIDDKSIRPDEFITDVY